MSEIDPHKAPPANKGLLVLAGVLLIIPCLALMPVSFYSDLKNPRGNDIGGGPMFVWYQMIWAFLTASFTSAAFIVVKKARPHVPMRHVGRHAARDESAERDV
ncbi:hypothetical protein [Yimella sp. cx-51]|uniref:hypothetical protein n=1 Tax=Yimella sp. cx-51 TaxID=2770551 RepID=UPI00165D6FF2|nr:hypothetical protein [Yimella sp. cx-51]MBC9956127.1 hypothetical protein [Yimella sp. cx-51]QTH37343.1 hypothetical protein J5M86_10690 [Yimella sp. cx-51]